MTPGNPHKPNTSDKLWTPANIVTLVRICLVPVFVVAILSPWPAYFGLEDDDVVKAWVAAAVFVLLASTDGVDGYLARSRGEVTDFGKFMDPLADKILVAAALLSLIELGVLPSWPALIILAREFIVSGIRMVAASKGTVIAASWYGKAKTVTQIIAIVLFIVKDGVVYIDPLQSLSSPLYLVSWAMMFIALALTIVSMLDYLVKARHLLGFVGRGSRAASDAVPASLEDLSDEALQRKASVTVALALKKGATIGCAESLTGGMIASFLTSIPGSSQAVRGGIVSYVNEVKNGVLGVSASTLDSVGAVSRETAEAMAEGTVRTLGCDVAVSATGIAGPGGAEPGKPVGTVWVGSISRNGDAAACLHTFPGDRDEVRRRTVRAALCALDDLLEAL